MDTTQGILCLCVPFYALYFLFAKLEHPKKKLLITGYLGGFAGCMVFMVLSSILAVSAAGDAATDFAAQYQQQMLLQQQQLQGMTGMPGMTAMPGMTPMPGMTGWPATAFPMTAAQWPATAQ